MKRILTFAFALLINWQSYSQDKESTLILITNVNVWDGRSDKLAKNSSVLIQDNLIIKVGKNIPEYNEALVIDGGGKTLIPGLSDAHVHLSATMSNR